MTEILIFPTSPPEMIRHRSDRPTIPIEMAETFILAHIGGAAAQIHLCAEYMLATGHPEDSEELSDAARKVKDIINKMLLRKK